MNNEIDNETIWLVRKTILNWMGLVIGVAAMRAALQAADLIPAQRLRDAEAHAERLEAALQEASELIHDLIDSGDGEVDRVQRLVRTALAPQPEAPDDERAEALNVIFDGPPGPTAGRFVEVETDDGRSVRAGEWIKRDDGLWSLRIRRYIERQPVRGEAGEESGDDHE